MKTFPLLILLSAISFAAFSQDLYEVPLKQRIAEANFIIEGKVLSKESFWNEAHNDIYTLNRVEVYKVFKGQTQATEVMVVTPGGAVGDDMILAEPSLKLQKQMVGLFLLKSAEGNANTKQACYNPFAGPQSFIEYDLIDKTAADPFKVYKNIRKNLYKVIQKKTRQPYIEIKKFDINRPSVKALVVPVINNFTPTSLSAGTRTLLTITGSGFESTQGNGYVSFKNADNGGATYVSITEPAYYQSWTDNTITLFVPGDAANYGVGTGTIRVTTNSAATATSSGQLTINFRLLELVYFGTIVPVILYDAAAGGYTFVPHTTVAANAPATAAFTRALNTWNCETLVNWNLSASTTSVNSAIGDGINIVRYDIGSELPMGALGVCKSYVNSCANFNAAKIYELDVSIDDGTNFQYGPALPSASQIDFESVHELGHGHQLGHVINNTAVMHFAIGTGTTRRTLVAAVEAAGGDSLISKSLSESIACPAVMTLWTNNPGCLPTSINEVASENILQNVYPNPASGLLQLELSHPLSVLSRIEIFNSLGQSFPVRLAGNNVVDVSSLDNGIYFIRISDSVSSSSYRFVVAR
jgi:hypothetical protein